MWKRAKFINTFGVQGGEFFLHGAQPAITVWAGLGFP
jgi:hypothetical protein